jgi:hypothetical protein
MRSSLKHLGLGPFLLLLLSLSTLLALPTTATTGCASSPQPAPQTARDAALDGQAVVALAVQHVLRTTERAIEQAAANAYAAIGDSGATEQQIAAERAKLKASYAPIEASYELAAVAYDAYRSALLEVVSNPRAPLSLPTEFASALLSRWRDLVDAARPVGLDLLPLPFVEEVVDGR